ncbi:hypothetical protein ACOMHN_032774 [Nucella lapillus]
MWVLQVALAAVTCLLAPSAGHFFEDGYSHDYTYRADNSLFDQHNVTTILKFHIKVVNVTEEGHRLHSLHVDSLVQFIKDGAFLNNPLHWDLTKTFLFVSEASGQIRVVHCHPEDHEELLVIKKAMVSIFSVHVQIEEDKEEWSYTADEQDHLGRLSHQYTAQRRKTGLKLHRKHFSSDEVFRTHEKTLHYDHVGTLLTALATDHVLVKDRSPKQTPSILPGEKPHNVVSSGDFPSIEAHATVKVTLDGKRINQRKTPEVFHNLTAQTLETKLKSKPSQSLENVQKNISRVFDCLKQFPQQDSEKRSICINELRGIMRSLHKGDYITFVNRHLGSRCPNNETICEDRRLVLIDVVARLGDVTSQELLMTHVLTKEPAVNEELRRVFIHSVALERPTEAFIHCLEKLCFGPHGEHTGSKNMTRTQSRACLAVGSVAKRCVDGGHQATADRLVDRLETWLDLHAAGDHHVSKRHTWLEEEAHEDHHMSKAVLLHALGNAALLRSRPHLLLHATPNRGHPLWRRAALDAMRHYNCTETVRSLLGAMEQDDTQTVRQTALSVYVHHPRRLDALIDRENAVLRLNYTYPVVARVKRSVFDTVLARFSVFLPKVDWKKEMGSKAVGASFGLYFENRIDALFRVLNGEVKIAVHDKVWAEIHLGIIDKQFDIFRAELCYKGRLVYNVNIMKDFQKNKRRDSANAFDEIAATVVEPIEKIVNELSIRYQELGTNQPKSGFDLLAEAVKELPEKTQPALQSTIELSRAADGVSGLPLISKLQQVAARAQALMEDVHSEATDLFMTTKEAAVVALPFAEKEIRQTLNIVLEQLGKVRDHPRQVFSYIDHARMSFYLAMQRILESNSVIKEATAYFSGSRSSFMNVAHELSILAASAKHVAQRLKAGTTRQGGSQTDTWTDTEENLGAQRNTELQRVVSRVDSMASQLDAMKSVARQLQQGLDRQATYTELLKNSYQSFKLAIDFAKSRISAVFGQKFHPEFPNVRRDCDGQCGCGYYPTRLDRYGHPGMDIELEPGKEIISPVAGLATPSGNNSVSIQPATADFKEYRVILSNIELTINLTHNGTFVDSGQVLGVPLGQNGCEKSHFHVATKLVGSDANASQCFYVDPFQFLDRQQPVSGWQPECKDLIFRHIGSVVDLSAIAGALGAIVDELKRFALSVGKDLLLKAISQLPESDTLGFLKTIASDIVRNIDVDAGSLKNLFGRGSGRGRMKNFFKSISTKKFNLKGMLSMTKNKLGSALRSSLTSTTSLISTAKKMAQNPRLKTLKYQAMGSVARMLSSRNVMCANSVTFDLDKGVPPLIGGCEGPGVIDSLVKGGVAGFVTSKIASFFPGRLGMMSALKSSACQVCPALGRALAQLSKVTCLPRDNCLGMDCDVQFEKSPLKVKVDINVEVDPELTKVTIDVEGNVHIVTGNVTKTLQALVRVFKVYRVKLKVATAWQGKQLTFSLGVEACDVERCLPAVQIANNLKFAPSSRKKRFTPVTGCRGRMLDYLESHPLDRVGKTFADINLPTKTTNMQIHGIQRQMSSAVSIIIIIIIIVIVIIIVVVVIVVAIIIAVVDIIFIVISIIIIIIIIIIITVIIITIIIIIIIIALLTSSCMFSQLKSNMRNDLVFEIQLIGSLHENKGNAL